jgi:spore coat polysaccharide biosynthesis protein SpsF
MSCAILITARLKSTRLPLKILKKIHGKPMIKHMIDRLKLSKIPSQIILCTSTVSQDDPLEELAIQENIKCYRGDPEDVLLRLFNAAKKFKVDTVINCTADNPFVDPKYIDLIYDFHIKQGNDFSKINGLPWGTFSYAISTNALEKACELKDESDTEVWHGYFMETGNFKWGSMKVEDKELFWPDLRLTVDVPEDFEMISRIFDELYDGKSVFSLKEILALCKKKPQIPKINNNISQKKGIPIKIKN